MRQGRGRAASRRCSASICRCARRRSIFNVSSPARLDGCPLLIDPIGVYFRPEGRTWICGTSPASDNDPDNLPLDEVDRALFDDVI